MAKLSSMAYWLVKTEPGTYSWADLERDKKTVWDGVRNFLARRNLKAMKKGDRVFVYHTGDEKAVIGLARVSAEAYPDPKDPAWSVVELVPEKKLKRPVSLAQVKAEKKLAGMVLVRSSRLSVQPVQSAEADHILTLSAG
jgi:predicted RNA-binding protein with PUA-like domain